MRMEINFALGKNEGCIFSSLGGRLISVGRQEGRQKGIKTKIFAIQQLQFSEF